MNRKPKRVVVLGANGQLGQSFKDYAANDSEFEWAFLTHNDLDITDRMAVWSWFKDNIIDICINCAAYTNVDGAEDDTYNATKVNYIGVLNLAEQCKAYNVLFVTYSTDYLFSDACRGVGRKLAPYTEKQKPIPDCTYGATKLAGEVVVKEVVKPNYIIIRTSWVFSEYGKNFLKAIVAKISNGEQLKVVNDQYGCPTYAADLVEGTMKLINKHYKDKGHKIKRCRKTYNFNNGEVMSWYEFACTIANVYGKKAYIEPVQSSEYKSKARRPSHSALSINKYKKATKNTPNSVTHAVVECINFLREWDE